VANASRGLQRRNCFTDDDERDLCDVVVMS